MFKFSVWKKIKKWINQIKNKNRINKTIWRELNLNRNQVQKKI